MCTLVNAMRYFFPFDSPNMFLRPCQRLLPKTTRINSLAGHTPFSPLSSHTLRVTVAPSFDHTVRWFNSTPNKRTSTTPTPEVSPPVQQTWVDRLPTRIQPYLYLTRIDKPIGTLLLYYPCSMCTRSAIQIRTH